MTTILELCQELNESVTAHQKALNDLEAAIVLRFPWMKESLARDRAERDGA